MHVGVHTSNKANFYEYQQLSAIHLKCGMGRLCLCLASVSEESYLHTTKILSFSKFFWCHRFCQVQASRDFLDQGILLFHRFIVGRKAIFFTPKLDRLSTAHYGCHMILSIVRNVYTSVVDILSRSGGEKLKVYRSQKVGKQKHQK